MQPDAEIAMEEVLREVAAERHRQHAQWGEQSHPDGTGGAFAVDQANAARRRCEDAFAAGVGSYRHILDEEVAEAFAESDPAKLREELVQVAAVAVAWVETIDRRMAAPLTTHPCGNENMQTHRVCVKPWTHTDRHTDADGGVWG